MERYTYTSIKEIQEILAKPHVVGEISKVKLLGMRGAVKNLPADEQVRTAVMQKISMELKAREKFNKAEKKRQWQSTLNKLTYGREVAPAPRASSGELFARLEKRLHVMMETWPCNVKIKDLDELAHDIGNSTALDNDTKMKWLTKLDRILLKRAEQREVKSAKAKYCHAFKLKHHLCLPDEVGHGSLQVGKSYQAHQFS